MYGQTESYTVETYYQVQYIVAMTHLCNIFTSSAGLTRLSAVILECVCW